VLRYLFKSLNILVVILIVVFIAMQFITYASKDGAEVEQQDIKTLQSTVTEPPRKSGS
jgi:hypothetical protein